VSGEELMRRALVAARDRLDRANFEAAELRVMLSAAELTYGRLHVAAPKGVTSRSNNTAALNEAAYSLETELANTRNQVHEAISAARAVHLEKVSVAFLATVRSAEPVVSLSSLPSPRAHRSSERQVSPEVEALRVIRRLPGDATEKAVERCEQLMAEIGAAESRARSEVLVAALRAEVQSTQTRSELVSKNRKVLSSLFERLDGLPGEDAGFMRGHLAGLALDSHLSLDLVETVEKVREEAERERDRSFALKVTREVLQQQGYSLGDDFVTVVASKDGVVLPLSASRRHGVRLRERAGQLLFNVVRFDRTEGGLTDPLAAEEFCASFDEIVRQSNERGLSMTRLTHFKPGDKKIEVRNSASPFVGVGEGVTTVEVDSPRPRRDQERERRR
jgi:hypothetical protein